METSSTSSSDRRPPRAFLAAACVVLAAEVALGVSTPRDRGRHVADAVLVELDAPQARRPVVLWGDSVTCGTIDPAVAGDWMVDVSSTQAISLAGVDYTYLRLVETAGLPDVLVLVTIPETWRNDLDQIFTPTYFESCFLHADEIADFVATTGRWAQGGRMALQAWVRPPSSQRQAGVRAALNRLRGIDTTKRGWLRGTLELADDTREGLAARATESSFRMSEIARLYVEKLAARTEADGVRLVLMTAALPRSVAVSWARNGYLRAYEEALRDVAARHPNVQVEPVLGFADYDDAAFYDPTHLMPQLRSAYGERVAARVREILEAAR